MRPSQALRKRKRSAKRKPSASAPKPNEKPAKPSAPATRTTSELEARLEAIERRLDGIDSTIGYMIDAAIPTDPRERVNRKYLSGRWPRQDGTVYGRLQQENGHDQRSRKPPPARR